MKVLTIKPEAQGIRIHGIGGIVFFQESWMKRNTIPLLDLQIEIDNKINQNNLNEARQ